MGIKGGSSLVNRLVDLLEFSGYHIYIIRRSRYIIFSTILIRFRRNSA